jgi:GDP-4-dehydro-6-deoxy-D-mannose reductase
VRILVTGAAGFVGQHLLTYLAAQSPQPELHGVVLNPADRSLVSAHYHTLDLRDADAISALIAALHPEHIYHLAAQANVGRSHDHVWDTLETNIHLQVNLLEAVRRAPKSPRVVVVSSGEIYGNATEADRALDESAPFRPTSPYSVSKIAQDMLGLQYFITHQLPIMRARPFNHLGPGQGLGFVAPDFAMQIARIEAGQQESVIRVGNLQAERDFTDVRDIVRAYHLIMSRGTPGDAYNIAAGKTCTIDYVLKTLLGFSSVPIEVRIDTALLRPGNAHRSCGDSSLLTRVTGWQPLIPLEQTLHDLLDDCRQRIKQAVNMY